MSGESRITNPEGKKTGEKMPGKTSEIQEKGKNERWAMPSRALTQKKTMGGRAGKYIRMNAGKRTGQRRYHAHELGAIISKPKDGRSRRSKPFPKKGEKTASWNGGEKNYHQKSSSD